MKLLKYIKTKSGEKVEHVVTSLNIQKRHRDFLDGKQINLSALVRDLLDELIRESEEPKTKP